MHRAKAWYGCDTRTVSYITRIYFCSCTPPPPSLSVLYVVRTVGTCKRGKEGNVSRASIAFLVPLPAITPCWHRIDVGPKGRPEGRFPGWAAEAAASRRRRRRTRRSPGRGVPFLFCRRRLGKQRGKSGESKSPCYQTKNFVGKMSVLRQKRVTLKFSFSKIFK